MKIVRERVWTTLLPSTWRNIATVMSGHVVNLALGFFASLIVVRTLSPVEFGLLSSASAVMAVIQRFMDLGIGNSVIRFASASFKADRSQSVTVLNVALLANLGLGVATVPVALWGAKPLATALFHEPQLIVLLQLAFLGAYFGGLTNYLGNVFRVYERFSAYSVVNVSSYLFKLALVAGLFVAHQVSVTPVFAAYVASTLLGVVVGASLAPREIVRSRGPRLPALRKIVSFGRWTLLTAVCGTALLRLELFLLAYFASTFAVGVYSLALFLYNILSIVMLAMNTVLLPQACQLTSKRDMWRYIRTNFRFSVVVAFGLALLFLAAGPLVTAVGTEKYLESIAVFQLLVSKLAVQVLIFPVTLLVYPLDRPLVETGSSALQVIVTLICGWLFIPRSGAVGAAAVGVLSTSVGMTLVAVYVFAKLRKMNS